MIGLCGTEFASKTELKTRDVRRPPSVSLDFASMHSGHHNGSEAEADTSRKICLFQIVG